MKFRNILGIILIIMTTSVITHRLTDNSSYYYELESKIQKLEDVNNLTGIYQPLIEKLNNLTNIVIRENSFNDTELLNNITILHEKIDKLKKQLNQEISQLKEPEIQEIEQESGMKLEDYNIK